MPARTEALVGSLEREWRDALCAKDLDRLRSLVHPQFVLIGTRGGAPFRMNREEWLQAIGRRHLVDIDLEIVEAAVFDQVMVGTIRANWCVTYLGQNIHDCVLLTDVWVRDEGRWQVVRRHSSPAPPAECKDG